jgi:osmotically inducible protein OsmC
MKRIASAHWKGTGAEGSGTLSTKSGALKNLPYSFAGRFQDESGTSGTNPEELIGAAHAGCFSMALSFQLTNAGFTPQNLKTEAVVNIEKQEAGWKIIGVELKLSGQVAGISKDQFLKLADAAKQNCPVSQALSAVDISLTANLEA